MDKQSVHIYDKDSISTLTKPSDVFAGKAYEYVAAIAKSPERYISNIRTSYQLLTIGTVALPMSVNDFELDNAYTCSPYTHYISYAYDELSFVPNRFLRFVCWVLLIPFSALFRISKINKVVVLNNWLLSTCLYPDIKRNDVTAITEHVQEVHRSHAIQWRSLQHIQHADLLKSLKDVGYILVPSRQVYIWKSEYYQQSTKRQRKNFNQDQRILQSEDMFVVPLDTNDERMITQLRKLYDKLYINKYSRCNPQLTDAFFELIQRLGIIDVYHLHHRKLEQHAVVGLFRNNTTVTAPILGYDTEQPTARKMYRACSAMSYQAAQAEGLTCHKSSGAPEFKRNRGCKPEVEYSAVYVKHLPWYRRLIWITVAGVLNKVAVPVMKKYEL